MQMNFSPGEFNKAVARALPINFRTAVPLRNRPDWGGARMVAQTEADGYECKCLLISCEGVGDCG